MTTGICSVASCENSGRLARGMCITCYNWIRNHPNEDPSTRVRRVRAAGDGLCTVTDRGVKCTKPSRTRKMCVDHYRNYRVHGDPLKLTRRSRAEARDTLELAAHTDALTCITFLSASGERRSVDLGGRTYMAASRAVWTIRYGDPGEQNVLHKCNGGSGSNGCININHLYLGDPGKNIQDRSEALRQVNEDHHNAKLTNGSALDALERHKAGEPVTSIARSLNVHHVTILDLIHGRTWKRLPGRDSL